MHRDLLGAALAYCVREATARHILMRYEELSIYFLVLAASNGPARWASRLDLWRLSVVAHDALGQRASSPLRSRRALAADRCGCSKNRGLLSVMRRTRPNHNLEQSGKTGPLPRAAPCISDPARVPRAPLPPAVTAPSNRQSMPSCGTSPVEFDRPVVGLRLRRTPVLRSNALFLEAGSCQDVSPRTMAPPRLQRQNGGLTKTGLWLSKLPKLQIAVVVMC